MSGAVQGIGFRPFVYRLATELKLAGSVSNSSQGVSIEIEGERDLLDLFFHRLKTEKPPLAKIQNAEILFHKPAGRKGFEILQSDARGEKRALILPDIATCPDCLREIFDPANRRYLYPFTNCTNCGPRFSIIESLPYDRANTSMKIFEMCSECESEYHDPRDRRFHAQPNACPKCGPQLESWQAAKNSQPTILANRHDALLAAAEAVREGKILALKGIGGFQMIVDARNEKAVQKLRERKRREEKPFALMFPSLDSVQEISTVSELEQSLLLSAESPIVLLNKKPKTQNSKFKITESVAPKNPYLGVMLPYSPLHHLLMRELGFPVVATSGNVSDEPICVDERDAFERLRGFADVFLVHNRPIIRHMDDSIARVVLGREMILRRARGYAPMPISVSGFGFEVSNLEISDSEKLKTQNSKLKTILAVGAHLKSTVALNAGNQIFISQHIGDLETEQAFAAFRKTTRDLPMLYDAAPERIACDLHPDYLSTKFAKEPGNGTPTFSVQHHYAHILSCMAENRLSGSVLGIAWDGTGLGEDQTIWGGEFLLVNETSFQRVAHLRTFRLPGGDASAKQPRRAALGVFWEIFGDELFARPDLIPLDKSQRPLSRPSDTLSPAQSGGEEAIKSGAEMFSKKSLDQFSPNELAVLRKMLAGKVNSPLTSSAGRLFDAAASLIGLRHRSSFEGQAAMELEFAIQQGIEDRYAFEISGGAPLVLDWEPMISAMLEDLRLGTEIGIISAKFHNTLVEMIVEIARRIGEWKIALSGGCFQNQYLLERAVQRLRAEGFCPHWHQRVPTNDGGIALGQIIAASRANANETAARNFSQSGFAADLPVEREIEPSLK
ncbi:MAG TPA: carbamoyltransferase HypF [Verrucomicrobiae bacterium]|nr:carbamoyltransferase HypF [Verrucomicrobiae bacterium]